MGVKSCDFSTVLNASSPMASANFCCDASMVFAASQGPSVTCMILLLYFAGVSNCLLFRTRRKGEDLARLVIPLAGARGSVNAKSVARREREIASDSEKRAKACCGQ